MQRDFEIRETNAMSEIIKISTVNFKTAWGNKQANLESILRYIEEAGAAGSDIIVLPEMSLTGYDVEMEKPLEEKMQYLEAETIPGPSSEKVVELTKKYGMYAAFGMPERDAKTGKLYNAACICGPEGIIGAYRKIHLPPPEMFWAEKGDEPMIFETKWGPVGVSICYDTYCFPELTRYTAAKGGKIHLNVTAYAKCHGNFVARASVEYAAAANDLFIASANLVGVDAENEFWGGSNVVGPGPGSFDCEYFAGTPFCVEEGMQEGMVTGEVDLTRSVQRIYGPNPNTDGKTDYRPDVYVRMMEDLLKDEKYQRNKR